MARFTFTVVDGSIDSITHIFQLENVRIRPLGAELAIEGTMENILHGFFHIGQYAYKIDNIQEGKPEFRLELDGMESLLHLAGGADEQSIAVGIAELMETEPILDNILSMAVLLKNG